MNNLLTELLNIERQLLRFGTICPNCKSSNCPGCYVEIDSDDPDLWEPEEDMTEEEIRATIERMEKEEEEMLYGCLYKCGYANRDDRETEAHQKTCPMKRPFHNLMKCPCGESSRGLCKNCMKTI